MQKKQIGNQFNKNQLPEISSDQQSIDTNNSPSKTKTIKKQERKSKEVAKQVKESNRDKLLVVQMQPLCNSRELDEFDDLKKYLQQQFNQCKECMQQMKQRIKKIKAAQEERNDVYLSQDYQSTVNDQFVKNHIVPQFVSQPQIRTFQNQKSELHVKIIPGQLHYILIYTNSCQIKSCAKQLRFYLICIGKSLTWLNNNAHIVYNNLLTKDFKVYKPLLDDKYYFYRLPYQFVKSYVSSQGQMIFQNGLKKILGKQYREIQKSIKQKQPQKQESFEKFEQMSSNPHLNSQPNGYVSRIFKQFKKKKINQLIQQQTSDPFPKYLEQMKIIYSRKDVLHFGILMLILTCPEKHQDILRQIQQRMFSQSQQSEQFYYQTYAYQLIIKNSGKVNFFNQTAIDLQEQKTEQLTKKVRRNDNFKNLMGDQQNGTAMEIQSEEDSIQEDQNDQSIEEFKQFLLILIIKCINPKMQMSSSELSKQLDKMWNKQYKKKQDQTNYR